MRTPREAIAARDFRTGVQPSRLLDGGGGSPVGRGVVAPAGRGGVRPSVGEASLQLGGRHRRPAGIRDGVAVLGYGHTKPKGGAVRGVRCSSVVVGVIVACCVWYRPDVGLALLLLGIPFTLVELWRPLRRQVAAIRRPGARTDAVSFVVNTVLAGLGLAGVLAFARPVVQWLMPDEVSRTFRSHPGWVRWIEAMVLSELCGYWGHRLSHEIPTLWRFHRVHHSAPELDWLAPHRRHPIDALIARSSTALPVLLLGASVPTAVSYFALKRVQGLLVHANVNLRLGPLERVVVTPFFHHSHHSAEPGTWNKNYAGSLPIVDWLFGTFYLPDRWPREYGCDGVVPDVGYINRFLSPWRTSTESLPVDKARPDSSVKGQHDLSSSTAIVLLPAADALQGDRMGRGRALRRSM